jgi:hypothetical protein
MTDYVHGSRLDRGFDEADDAEQDDLELDATDQAVAGRDARRAQLIAAAQAGWIDALTDLGGRNTLLYYKDRRAGTLDLGAAYPAAIDRFLRTGSARLTRLSTMSTPALTRSAASRSSTERRANYSKSAGSALASWLAAWPGGTSSSWSRALRSCCAA